MNGNHKKMKEIKLILKKAYRIIVIRYFRILYGKIEFKNNYKGNVQKIYLKKNNLQITSKKKYFVSILTNGRICTDSVEQVAYILDNKILNDLSYTQINGKLTSPKRNFVIKKGTPYFLKKFNGTVLSLAQGASGDKNYFHWLFDILPKIIIAQSAINFNKIDYFYMPVLQDFQKRILSLLGIKNYKIINSKKIKHLEATKIVIPSHPWYYKGTIFEEVNSIPEWIVKWLRKSFLKFKKKNIKSLKLFIDRSESEYSHCKLINNDNIKKILSKRGFKILQTGKLDFLKQIELFNNAHFVIGPHGAAFSNLVFCKPRTNVIEIKPKKQPNNYKKISILNNLNYAQINLKSSKPKYINEGDMYINPKTLLKLINILDKKK